jgi:hypothetical protein
MNVLAKNLIVDPIKLLDLMESARSESLPSLPLYSPNIPRFLNPTIKPMDAAVE